MREIKLWDKEQKKFLTKFYCFYKDGDFEFYNNDRDFINGIINTNVIVVESTGLKDKNGVEIYKSDLLKDDTGRIFKVIEDNRIGATGYIMECVKNKSEKAHIKVGNIYNFCSWITPFHCLEYIGNIYENPELLN